MAADQGPEALSRFPADVRRRSSGAPGPTRRRPAVRGDLETEHVAPVVVRGAVARVGGGVQEYTPRPRANAGISSREPTPPRLSGPETVDVRVRSEDGRPETVEIAKPKTKSDKPRRRADPHLERRRSARETRPARRPAPSAGARSSITAPLTDALRLSLSPRERAGVRGISSRPGECPADPPRSLLLRHPLAVARDGFARWPVDREASAVEPDRPAAALGDEREVVGDDQDVLPARSNSANFSRQRWENASSPTARTSSTRRTSGSLWAAIAKPSRTAMPEE